MGSNVYLPKRNKQYSSSHGNPTYKASSHNGELPLQIILPLATILIYWPQHVPGMCISIKNTHLLAGHTVHYNSCEWKLSILSICSKKTEI